MILGAFNQHMVCGGATTQMRRPASLVFGSGSARPTGPAPRVHAGSKQHFIASPWNCKNASRRMQHLTAHGFMEEESADSPIFSDAGEGAPEQLEETDSEKGLMSFEEILVDSTYLARVVKIVSFGIFVNLNSQTDALVHISEIADAYVSDINDYVRVNDIITVKVISKDATRMRIAASIKQSGAPIKAKYESYSGGGYQDNYDDM